MPSLTRAESEASTAYVRSVGEVTVGRCVGRFCVVSNVSVSGVCHVPCTPVISSVITVLLSMDITFLGWRVRRVIVNGRHVVGNHGARDTVHRGGVRVIGALSGAMALHRVHY